MIGLEEAIKSIKSSSKVKFDESIDIAVNITTDAAIRGFVDLPHVRNKKLNILGFCKPEDIKSVDVGESDLVGSQDLIDKIKAKSIKLKFDLAVADASMVKDVASIANILGPKRLMPNPKDGSVFAKDFSENFKLFKTVRTLLSSGKDNIIHSSIGKCSMADDQLCSNINAIIDFVKGAGGAIDSVYLSSTMGEAYSVKL